MPNILIFPIINVIFTIVFNFKLKTVSEYESKII